MCGTVPDLVFNELKFLQDSHEHQDERHADSNDHRPGAQDKKRELEREEISAYFNQRTSRDHARGPLHSRRTEPEHEPRHDDEERTDLPNGCSSPILPDKKLTSVPYLGFGSKGAINRSGNRRNSATTYLTWSESAVGSDNQKRRATNVQPTRGPGKPSTAKKAQQRRPERKSTSRPTSDIAEPAVRKRPPDVPEGQWSTSRRTRGPANVEVYIPQSNAEPDPSTSKRKLHDSTSISLPTRPSAQPARKRQQKGTVEQEVLLSDVGSFNTSDILKVRGRLAALADEAPPSIQSVRTIQNDRENLPPISTSPTAKILRIAHEAMAKGYEKPAPRSSKGDDQHYLHVDECERRHNSHTSLRNEGPRPDRVHLRDRDTNEFAYQPMQTHATMRWQGLYQEVQHDAANVPAAGFDPEDDEMLDEHTTFEPTFADHAVATPEYVPAHTHVPPTEGSDLHSLPFRYGRPSTRARDVPWSRGGTSAIHIYNSSHAATAEQGLLNEEDHVSVRDFEDGLEGFWRPNRLY